MAIIVNLYPTGTTDAVSLVSSKTNPCGCYTCDESPALRSRMYVCATCGNKRCPRATDHRNECHGSNAPGQEGSSYT